LKEGTMKKFLLVIAFAFVAGPLIGGKNSPGHPADNEHVVVRADAIKWGPSPPSLPPGGQIAVLVGDPSKPGAPYVLRARMPDGYRVPPHWHPTDENVTVLKGALLVGKGDKFDPAATEEVSAGSFMRMPKTMRHFAMARGETLLQLHGIGPFEINYVNADDDPRKRAEKK
jgi:quercetin dioxygenase-like cupin family protein